MKPFRGNCPRYSPKLFQCQVPSLLSVHDRHVIDTHILSLRHTHMYTLTHTYAYSPYILHTHMYTLHNPTHMYTHICA